MSPIHVRVILSVDTCLAHCAHCGANSVNVSTSHPETASAFRLFAQDHAGCKALYPGRSIDEVWPAAKRYDWRPDGIDYLDLWEGDTKAGAWVSLDGANAWTTEVTRGTPTAASIPAAKSAIYKALDIDPSEVNE